MVDRPRCSPVRLVAALIEDLQPSKRKQQLLLSYIAVASHTESGIEDLLRREYERSPSFTVVSNDSLKWSAVKKRSIVLAVWDNENRIIATMRSQILWSLEETEASVESRFADCGLSFPVMALTRAATDKAYQKSGLNSALRFYFVSFAISWGIRHFVGAVFKDSARTRLMEELGYTMFESPDLGTGCLIAPNGTHLSATLDLQTCGSRAIAVLKQQFSEALSDYPWRGKLPDRPW